jgi:putative chitinase
MSHEREAQLLLAATAEGITSQKELANFMAQTTHESHNLNQLEESFRYTQGIDQIPVELAWREGEEELEAARKKALAGQPEDLAELMYGNRKDLGNDQPGDGWKYHGRGYIQLTGKANYTDAGKDLNLDVVNHPELAANPANAPKIAVWFWKHKVDNDNRENVDAASRQVNGGDTNLKERQTRFEQWEKKLTPEVMAGLAKGEVLLPPKPEHARTLHQHSHGPAVTDLQNKLKALDYFDAEPNGRFGPATKHAVEAFQRDHDLHVDGRAGTGTLDAIHKAVEQHKEIGPQTDAAPTQTAPPASNPSQNSLHERANAGPDNNAPMPKADPSPSSLGNPDRASPLMDPDLQAIYNSNGDPAVMAQSAENYRNSPSGELFDMQAQAAAARVQPGAPEQQAAETPRVQQSGPSIGSP